MLHGFGGGFVEWVSGIGDLHYVGLGGGEGGGKGGGTIAGGGGAEEIAALIEHHIFAVGDGRR